MAFSWPGVDGSIQTFSTRLVRQVAMQSFGTFTLSKTAISQFGISTLPAARVARTGAVLEARAWWLWLWPQQELCWWVVLVVGFGIRIQVHRALLA